MQQQQLYTQPSKEVVKETPKDITSVTTNPTTTVTPNIDWQLKEPEKINGAKLEGKKLG
jgi:hypothetical protein